MLQFKTYHWIKYHKIIKSKNIYCFTKFFCYYINLQFFLSEIVPKEKSIGSMYTKLNTTAVNSMDVTLITKNLLSQYHHYYYFIFIIIIIIINYYYYLHLIFIFIFIIIIIIIITTIILYHRNILSYKIFVLIYFSSKII
jgi:hypothetical protein